MSQANALARWQASLALGFAVKGPKSVLVHNRHQGPLVVQKALYPEGPRACHAVVLHPPAGIAEGDNLAIDIDVASDAHAVIATPSATRWYKSAADFARQEVSITVGAGACLEWLPQENLFFENARAEQRLVIRAHRQARLIAWDAYMLGRSAKGESWQGGTVRLASELHVGNNMVFAERGEIKGGDTLVDGAPGLSGFRCGATLWALGDGLSSELAEDFAAQLPYQDDLKAAVSLPEPGVMVVRALGRDAEAVRMLLQRTWATLRPAVLGLAATPLRLWAC